MCRLCPTTTFIASGERGVPSSPATHSRLSRRTRSRTCGPSSAPSNGRCRGSRFRTSTTRRGRRQSWRFPWRSGSRRFARESQRSEPGRARGRPAAPVVLCHTAGRADPPRAADAEARLKLGLMRRVAARAQTIGTGFAVFVLAFLYRLPDASDLINDHFMHLVFGRQLLWGRLPVRDAVSLGMPLQTGLSAFAEWLVGYRLLSEGLIISTAFAAAAVLTFVLIQRATGSLLIAVAGALLEVAIAPRTYSYPKLVVYAAGILLLWRYVDRPSNRRAVELGLATAVAFYLRHDHGLYLGLSAVAVMAMRHGRSLRTAVQQVAVLAATCVLLVAPFFAYVEAFGSVRDYATDLRQF